MEAKNLCGHNSININDTLLYIEDWDLNPTYSPKWQWIWRKKKRTLIIALEVLKLISFVSKNAVIIDKTKVKVYTPFVQQ